MDVEMLSTMLEALGVENPAPLVARIEAWVQEEQVIHYRFGYSDAVANLNVFHQQQMNAVRDLRDGKRPATPGAGLLEKVK